jgi:hypothetical protein
MKTKNEMKSRISYLKGLVDGLSFADMLGRSNLLKYWNNFDINSAKKDELQKIVDMIECMYIWNNIEY